MFCELKYFFSPVILRNEISNATVEELINPKNDPFKLNEISDQLMFMRKFRSTLYRKI